MAQGLDTGDDKGTPGCTDPLAINYNAWATISTGPSGPYLASNCVGGSPPGTICSGECYKVITNNGGPGCLDPTAINYDQYATSPCDNCCLYGEVDTNNPIEDIVINPNGFEDNAGDTITPCNELDYEELPSGEIVYNGGSSITHECCTWYQSTINTAVSWNDTIRICYVTEETNSLCDTYDLDLISSEGLQNRVTCIDCDNFAWWDNLYTLMNGDTLQHINAPLWDFLVSVITSDPTSPVETTFGNGSFYVDALTGEPIISENCCTALSDSNFVVNVNEFDEESSACLCDTIQETTTTCECVETIDTFMSIISTVSGASLLLTPNVLSSLGFTSDEINFIINNSFSGGDIDNDGVVDNVQVRVLLANALALSGGFYLCYETATSAHSEQVDGSIFNQDGQLSQGVSSAKCEELGGFFDGTLCFCKSQDECNIGLTEITMTTTVDSFNQNITIVTINGESISEVCCLKIASDNQLPWVYKGSCYTSDPNPCLPLEFKLNNDLIKPKCETPIDVSVSFYFGKPENPCTPFVDDGDVIIVGNPTDPCILEFDENNNLIDYKTTTINKRTPAEIAPPPPLSGDTEAPCCYNSGVPIVVNLIIRDDNNNVIQTSEPFSFVDVETWFDLTTQFTIPTTGTTEGFNSYLQFTHGLNCCCIYDIFLDNFNFNCNEEIDIVEIINNDCPGFEIVPVIDNKKSWVYNPGEINYSNIQNNDGKLTDNVIIKQGQFGLIQGYGVINRTFAPSLDADLDWRYTDYFKQSSVLEKHSNLVLNSKELFLTFDMCSDCCVKYSPCPEGYTLSAGTETCYKYVLDTKQFQNNVNFDFQDGVEYDFN
jgi:hypothetical protein